MIKKFADKATADIYDGANSKYARKIPEELHSRARRLLDQLNASPNLEFLRIPPGNRLEKMSGNFEEFWSVRINDQWRIIFQWSKNNAYNVKITDYH